MEKEEMGKRVSRVRGTFDNDPVQLAGDLVGIAKELANERLKYSDATLAMSKMDERTANSSCLLYASQILHAASLIKFIYGE